MSDMIEASTETVGGRVITASDPDYDGARAVYNAMHDRRPLAVVQCADSGDVVAVIVAARDSDVDLAIRGGGHSVPGFGTDDGLVVDLSAMKGVRVEPIRRVARVGGGATVGDASMRPSRSAAPRPVESSPRPGGGNEDLFWAARGGGNFGVVTSLELELHEVGDVVGGSSFYDCDDAMAVRERYRHRRGTRAARMLLRLADCASPAVHPRHRVEDLFCVLVTSTDHHTAHDDGADFEQLSAVKAVYDPDNLLHVNQDIAPAQRG